MMTITPSREKGFILYEYKTALQQGRTKYAQRVKEVNSDIICESEWNVAFDEVVGSWMCKNK